MKGGSSLTSNNKAYLVNHSMNTGSINIEADNILLESHPALAGGSSIVLENGSGARDVAAVTYAADPEKKGLERVLAAWAAARRGDETLHVTGLDRDRLPADLPAGVEVTGRLERDAYRALLRRAKVFVTAPRREDHGIAQLEALADGCVLITTPAPGPYAALPIARELDARLVTDDLAPAIRAALDDPAPRYHERTLPLLQPLTAAAVDRVVALDLLPRLLA